MIRSLRSDPVNARIGSSRQTAASGRDGSGTPIGVPLPERVADALRDDILKGRFSPGEALRETAIAEEFEVSRAPVREALRILAAEGLVESLPYRHTRVRRITSTEIEEVYSLRGQLEAFAVERLVTAPAPVDLSVLRRSCEAMRRHAERQDMESVSAEDENFHRQMIALTGHALLSGVWDMVTIRMRFIIAMRNRHNADPMAVADNHPPIVDAIARRDIDEARYLIARHVRSAADLIVLMDEDARADGASAGATDDPEPEGP